MEPCLYFQFGTDAFHLIVKAGESMSSGQKYLYICALLLYRKLINGLERQLRLSQLQSENKVS